MDPVYKQSSPNMAAAAVITGKWIDDNAARGGRDDVSNIIARIGKQYGSAPAGIATQFFDIDASHATIAGDVIRSLRVN